MLTQHQFLEILKLKMTLLKESEDEETLWKKINNTLENAGVERIILGGQSLFIDKQLNLGCVEGIREQLNKSSEVNLSNLTAPDKAK